jgi:flavin-dependent dehydrogenase
MGSGKMRVVIAGGGPGGAASAIALARLGLHATVLEASAGPAAKAGECLPPNVNPLLHELGLANRLRRDGHFPSYGNRSVWGTATPVESDFLFGVHGEGWHLDRRRFESLLAEIAREHGTDWRCGHRLEDCCWRDRSWELRVRTDRGFDVLSADFVIDATGRAARVARRQGARRVRYDRLVGVATVLQSDGAGITDSFTLVEAVASGWWYSAPLADAGLTVVYMTDGDLLERTAVDPAGWQVLLRKAEQTRSRVCRGGYRLVEPPRVVPADTSRIVPAVGVCWLAVGDAAAAYDPLSSYGIGSALGTGYYAAEAITEAAAGRPGAAAYGALIDRAFDGYLARYREQYALERRWPTEPFWRRRQLPSAGAS